MISAHLQQSTLQRVTILTCDPATQRIEAIGKDGAVLQVLVAGINLAFRWPIEGEDWMIRRENGYWYLDNRFEELGRDPQPVATLHPGDLQLDSDVIYDNSGLRLVSVDLPTYGQGQVISWNQAQQKWQATTITADIPTGAITGTMIAPGTITGGTGGNLAPSTITSANIFSVSASTITGTISANQINTITAGQITGSITATQIGSVNATAIQGSITSGQIGSVNATAIQGNITSGQIGSVNASAITGSITSTQIGSVSAGAITGSIVSTQIGSVAASVITGTIAAGQIASITASQITGTIQSTQINTITAGQITGTIQSTQINTITAGQITGSIGASQIGSVNATAITGSITSGQIGSVAATTITGSITSGQIGSVAATTITGSILAAQIGSVNASAISGSISASQIGTVNATAIQGGITSGQISSVNAGVIAGSLAASNIPAIGSGNKIYNSRADAGVGAWRGYQTTITQSSSRHRSGSYSFRVVSTVASTAYLYIEYNDSTAVTVIPGESITITGYAWGDVPRACFITARWWDGTTATFSSGSNVTCSTSGWTQVSATFTVPAGVTAMGYSFSFTSTVIGDAVNWTDLQLEEGVVPTGYAPKPDEILPGTVTGTQIASNAAIQAGQISSVNATAITGSILAAQIGSVNATAITGSITSGQIGSVAATTITGTISSGQIGTVNASAIQGLIASTQIGSVAATTITGSITSGQIGSVAATTITGSITSAQIGSVNASAISGSITAAQIGSVNASAISGSITSTQIGSVAATAITGSITSGQIGSVNATVIGGTLPAGTIPQLGGNNKIPNSRADNGTTGWSTSQSSLSTSTAQSRSGPNSFLVTSAGGTGTDAYIYVEVNSSSSVKTVAGQVLTLSAWAYTVTSGLQTQLQLRQWDGTTATYQVGSTVTLPTSTWTRLTSTFTVPANVYNLGYSLYWHSTAIGNVVYVTDIQLEEGVVATAYGPKPDEILPGTVTGAQIASNAAIVAGQISSVNAGAITGSIISSQIGSVNATAITGSITSGQISSVAASTITGSITSGQIGSVAASTITGSITSGQIGSVAATTITGSITSAQIGSVSASAITGSISSTQIGSVAAASITGSITSTQIGSVYAGNIVVGGGGAGKITGGIIDAGTITASNIQSGTITATQIAASTITTTQIAANTIDATRLNLVAGGANLSQNSGFANGATGYTSGATTIALDSTLSYPGTSGRSLKLTTTSATDIQIYNGSYAPPVKPNTSYVFTGWVWSDTAARSSQVYINWYNASSTYISVSYGTASNSVVGAWTPFVIVATSPSTAASAMPGILIHGCANAEVHHIGAVQLQEGTMGTAYSADGPQDTSATFITPGTITVTQISNSAGITGSQIATTTITGSNISTGTITASNILSGTITGTQIAATTISASNIVSATITSTQIAASTITGTNIAATTIAASNIVSGTITTTQIAATTITGSNIAAATITGTNIAATTISASNIVANTITAAQIATGTITATQIAANTITGTQIAAQTITVSNVGFTVGGGNMLLDSYFAKSGLPDWSVYSSGGGGTVTIVQGYPRRSGTNGVRLTRTTTGTADMGVSQILTGRGIIGNAYTLSAWVRGPAGRSATIQINYDATATGTGNFTFIGPTTWQRVSVTIAAGAFTTQLNSGYVFMYSSALNDTFDTTDWQFEQGTLLTAYAPMVGEILPGTVTGTQIAATTISGSNIATGTITGTNIAGTTITASNIVSGTITGTQIAATTITSANIASGTITASNISAGTITGAQIAADTITTKHIVVGTIGDNLLMNPGFEDNAGDHTIPTGWYDGTSPGIGSGVAGYGAWGPNLLSTPEGSWHLAIVGLTGGLQGAICSKQMAVEAGLTYIVRFWAMNDNATNSCICRIQERSSRDVVNNYPYISGGNRTSGSDIMNQQIANTWTLYSFTYTAPAGVKFVSVQWNNASANATDYMRLDAVEFRRQFVAGNIAAGAITATQIAAQTITATQIAANTITGSNIAATTITAGNIVSGTITGTQIAATTITASNIATATITSSQIASGTITATNIQSGTITGTLIAGTTITAANIASATITTTQIAASTITGSNIAAGTITGTNIAATTITGSNIASSTITASNITVSSLSALSANLGSITAGTITGATFQSSSSNPRVVMDSTGVYALDSSGTVTFKADAVTGKIITLAGIGGGNLLSNSRIGLPDAWPNGGTLVTSTAQTKFGSNSALFTTNNTSVGNGPVIEPTPSNNARVEAGKTYTWSAWVLAGTAGRTAYVTSRFGNASGTLVVWNAVSGSGSPTALSTTAWTRVSVTGVVPSGNGIVFSGMTLCFSSTAVGETFYTTGYQMEEGALATAWAPKPDEILPGIVTGGSGGMLASATITGANIAANTITASLIQANTITASQIASGTITGTQIAGTTITGSNIAASTITGGNIAGTTITAGNIVSGTITATQIAAATITGDRIVASTITGGNIAAGTITGSNLVAGTITATYIATGTITSSQIAAGTITSSNIASGTITSGNIATGTITVGNLGFTIGGGNQLVNSSFEDPTVNLNNWGMSFGISNIQTINLATNPSFEVDLTGWSAAADGTLGLLNNGGTITRVTTQSMIGSAAMQVVTTAANAFQGAVTRLPGTSFTTSQTYTASLWIKGNAGGENVTLTLGNNGSGGGFAQTGVTLTTSWQRVSVTWTPSTNAILAGLDIQNPAGTAYTYFVDGVQITQTSGVIDYFDGSTIGSAWTGTPHASTSYNNVTLPNLVPNPGFEHDIGGTVNGTVENMVLNPSMEQDTLGASPASWSNQGGWNSWFNGSGIALSTVSGGIQGTHAMQVGTNATSPYEGAGTVLGGSFTANVSYTVSVWLKGNAGGENVGIFVGDSTNSANANSGIPVTLTTTWTRYNFTWTPTTGTSSVLFGIRTGGTAVAYTWFVDGVMVSPTPTLQPYVDGNSSGVKWSGTAGNSTTIGYGPAAWFAQGSLLTTNVQTGWAANGSASLRLRAQTPTGNSYPGIGTNYGTSGISIIPGAHYTFYAQVNVLSAPTGSAYAVATDVSWYDASGTQIRVDYPSAPNSGTGRITLTGAVTAPVNARYCQLVVYYNSTAAGFLDMYVDSVQFVPGTVAPTYFDGDSIGDSWSGTVGNSYSYMPAQGSQVASNYVARYGNNSLALTKGLHYTYTNQNIVAQGQQPITVSVWVYYVGGATTPILRIVLRPNAGTNYLTTTAPTLTPNTWQRISYTIAPNSSLATTAQVSIGWESGEANTGDIAYIDGVQAEFGSLLTAYAPKPDEILPQTVTGGQIANTTITGGNIVTGTITATQIQTGTITATQIQTATITSTQIAANTITATNIAAGTITATQLNIVPGGANLHPNSSFANGLTGYISDSATGTLSIDSTVVFPGSTGAGSMKVTATVTGGVDAYRNAFDIPATPGLPYTATAWVRNGVGSRSAYIGIQFFDNTNTIIGTTTYSTGFQPGTTSWQPTTITATAPSGTTHVRCFANITPGAINDTMWIGAFQIQQGTVGTAYSADGPQDTTATMITPGTITTNQIAANTIQGTNIAGTTITASNIASGTITTTQISASAAIIGGQLAANTITASQIASGTITSTQIATGTITVGNLGFQMGGNNLLANSSFENSSGWTVRSGYGTGAYVSTPVVDGSKALQMTAPTGSIVVDYSPGYIPILPNTAYTLSGYYRSASAVRVGRPQINWYDNTATYISTVAGAVTYNTSSTGWVRPYVTGTSPSNATLAGIFFNVDSTVSGEVFYLDAVQLEQGGVMTAYAPPGSEILPGTVTGTQIASTTITGGNIATGTITATQIATGTITATQIASSTITSTQIATGTITVGNLGFTVGGGNLLQDSSFESTVWSGLWAGSGATRAASTTQAKYGTASLAVTWSSGTDPYTVYTISDAATLNALKGNIVTMSAWVFVPSGLGTNVSNRGILLWDGSASNEADINSLPTNIWQRIQTSITVGTSATSVYLRLYNGYQTGGPIYYDGIQLEIGGMATAYAPKPDEILPGTVTGGTGGMIATTTITGGNISTGTITATQIAATTITATQISATAGITGGQIAGTTITAGNIAGGTITATQISATAGITAGQIATGTLTATQISATAGITAGQIATGTLTATQISATAGITGGQIAGTTITAGNIAGGTITATQISATAGITAGMLNVTTGGANLHPNSSFANGISTYQGNSGSSAGGSGTLSLDTTLVMPGASGTGSLKLVSGGTATANYWIATGGTANFAKVTPGASYIASGWINSAATSRLVTAGFDWYKSDGTVISEVSGGSVSTVVGQWTQVSYVATAPALAAYGRVLLYINSVPNTSEVHNIGGVQLQQGTMPTSYSADGPQDTSSTFITPGTITTTQISPTAGITGGAGGQIATTTITGSNIATGTITATQITVTSLSALSANLGTVTAGTLSSGTTFAGALSAATGTFSGSLSAATGTFAGSLSAATGTFSGALSAATGSFSGTISSSTMTSTTITGGTVQTASSGARVVIDSTGLNAYNGSGVAQLSFSTSTGNATFKGDITGASGTFSGTIAAANITSGTIPSGVTLPAAQVGSGSLPTGVAVADGSISVVTINKLSGTISAATIITPNTISSGLIVANAITTEKLTVGGFSDSSLANGGFEDVSSTDGTMAANWRRAVAWGGTSSTAFRITSGNIRSGAASLTLIPGSGASADVMPDTVPVSAGDSYYISCWAIASGTNAGTSGGFYVRLRGGSTFNASGTEIQIGVESVVVPTSWTKYEGQVAIPSGMTFGAPDILVYQTNTGATINVDDVVFKKVITPGTISATSLSAISANLGTITAGTLTSGTIFAGALSAATGTFAGSLSAATGTFSGSLSAVTGSFSGTLSGASITGASGTIGGITFNASGISSTNFSVSSSGVLTATGATISGASSFAGTLSGATGSFSGTLSGASITGASGTIGGITFNASGISSTNFNVTSSGVLTATGGNFSGSITSSTMTGGTVTGATIQTASSGARVWMDTTGLYVDTATVTKAITVDGTNGLRLNSGSSTWNEIDWVDVASSNRRVASIGGQGGQLYMYANPNADNGGSTTGRVNITANSQDVNPSNSGTVMLQTVVGNFSNNKWGQLTLSSNQNGNTYISSNLNNGPTLNIMYQTAGPTGTVSSDFAFKDGSNFTPLPYILQNGIIGSGDCALTINSTTQVTIASGLVVIGGQFEVGAVSTTISAIPNAVTYPRLDQIVVTKATWGNNATISRVAGTETAGATLANRSGSPALAANQLRLFDILIPVGAGGVTAGNVRDRRPWARGAYYEVVSNGFPTVSTSWIPLINSSGMRARIEHSGVPTKLTLSVSMAQGASANHFHFQPYLDGATYAGTPEFKQVLNGGSGYTYSNTWTWWVSGVTGSHLWEPYFAGDAVDGSMQGYAWWRIEEVLHSSANNGTS